MPISHIPQICTFVEELGKRRKVKVVTFGHSGDGNIHVNFMAHWNKPDEIARVKKAIKDAAKGGGYILSASHSHPYVDATRMKWMVEAAHKYGKYPL